MRSVRVALAFCAPLRPPSILRPAPVFRPGGAHGQLGVLAGWGSARGVTGAQACSGDSVRVSVHAAWWSGR